MYSRVATKAAAGQLASKTSPRTSAWLCRRCIATPSPFARKQVRTVTIRSNDGSEAAHTAVGNAPRPKNPLDYVNNPKDQKAYRAQVVRRMKFLSVGLAVCILAQLIIIKQMPSEEELAQRRRLKDTVDSVLSKPQMDAPNGSSEAFQGKPIHVVGGGAKLVATDEKTGEEIQVVETGTSTIPHFPKTIRLPSGSEEDAKDSEYTLLGLGIRTVSFLSIQVYVVGMYVQTSTLNKLQESLVKHVNPGASALIPGEKEKLKSGLLEADYSYDFWDSILKDRAGDVKTAFRIVPTRNTDFQHLKDGWVRGITAKTQVANSKGDDQFQDDTFGATMKDFKGMFTGQGKAPKGSVVLLSREGNGSLTIFYQDKDSQGMPERVGFVPDERIARLIWLGYLGGKSVSSEAARKNIVDGIMELVERPIGSVETMVL